MLKNCDSLFSFAELSAAPDVGWPDNFNSGVFVFAPSYATYDQLVECAQKSGSFTGSASIKSGLYGYHSTKWFQEATKLY